MLILMAERVFLCDDNDAYRLLLREVLTAEGMEIVGEGDDGDVCIEAVSHARPDIVLLDINMPRMNGFEALPTLRQQLPDAKLIVLSSAPQDHLSLSAAQMLGADGYMTKPASIFSMPVLLRRALAT